MIAASRGKRFERSGMTFVAIMAPAILIAATMVLADEWQIECLDCPGWFGFRSDRCFRIDDAGQYHVAYGGDHLYYAYQAGDGWIREVVDDDRAVGDHASIALDSDGQPHVVYCDDGNTGVRYAYRDQDVWFVELIDTVHCEDTSIAVDEFGYPHVVYSSDGLRHAYRDSSGWHHEMLYDQECLNVSLAIDEGGGVHVCYSDDTTTALGYAYEDSEGWHVETVVAEVGTHVSLAIGQNGTPCVAYLSPQGWVLKYATRQGGTWALVETVDEYGGSFCSLGIDRFDQPHISYYRGGLYYAYRNEAGWDIEDLGMNVGTNFTGHSSISLDATEIPHIVHWHHGTGDLEHVYRDSSGWLREPIDSGGDVGSYTSIALDSSGYMHVGYQYGWPPAADLKYARRDASGFVVEIVDDSWNVGAGVSLELDSTDLPHFSYQDGADHWLMYAYLEDTQWVIESVANYASSYTSLALDGNGFPHVSFSSHDASGTVYTMNYAFNDGTGWQIEVVDSDLGSPSVHNAIVIDGSGIPNICYYYWSEESLDLRYARREDSEWAIGVVENGLGWPEYYARVSLVLDELGYPHVSYLDVQDENLKYARLADSTWIIQTVDEVGIVGSYASLTLDPSDHSHISYYDASNTALKYAYLDGDSWQIETLDSEGDVGTHTSISLDAAGYVHISYHDETMHDLKYISNGSASAFDFPSRPASPGSVQLLRISPNPVTTGTTILYSLGLGSGVIRRHVALRVYDAAGREVARPVDEVVTTGIHSIRWNLTEQSGGRIPSGAYWVRIATISPKAHDISRLVVLK